MNIPIKRLLLSLVFCVAALSASAASYDLGKAGDLSFNLPATWTVKTKALGELGYEFQFSPVNGTNSKALMTVIKLPQPRPINQAEIDQNLKQASERFITGSVEKKAVLKPYKVQQGYGVYAVFTDADLVGKPSKPDDFKVMIPGIIQPNEQVQMIVTLLTDDLNGPELAALRTMVESLRLTPAKP